MNFVWGQTLISVDINICQRFNMCSLTLFYSQFIQFVSLNDVTFNNLIVQVLKYYLWLSNINFIDIPSSHASNDIVPSRKHFFIHLVYLFFFLNDVSFQWIAWMTNSNSICIKKNDLKKCIVLLCFQIKIQQIFWWKIVFTNVQFQIWSHKYAKNYF